MAKNSYVYRYIPSNVTAEYRDGSTLLIRAPYSPLSVVSLSTYYPEIHQYLRTSLLFHSDLLTLTVPPLGLTDTIYQSLLESRPVDTSLVRFTPSTSTLMGALLVIPSSLSSTLPGRRPYTNPHHPCSSGHSDSLTTFPRSKTTGVTVLHRSPPRVPPRLRTPF